MKNWFYAVIAVVFAMFLVSCNNVEELDFDEKIVSTVVTPDMAREQLEDFLSKFETQTRSGKKRTIKNMYVLGGFAETRANDSTEDEPLVYLFNFENDEGYSIVSGDTRVPDIMAFVENGNLDPEKGTDNPGLAMFLSNADTYYRAMTGLPIYDENNELVIYNIDDPMNPIPYTGNISYPAIKIRNFFTPWQIVVERGSVIPCEWTQTGFFNDYCFTDDGREAYAGCVAIAVAQIMYHHSKSITVGDDYYEPEYYDWSIMRTATDVGAGSQRARYLVSRLIGQIGDPNNLNMNYGAVADGYGSGAYGEYVSNTFRNFGYNNGGTYQDYDITIATLPVYVEGYAIKERIPHNFLGITWWSEDVYSSGHAWVIDKMMVQHRRKTTYDDNGLVANTQTEARQLVHCNWGWGGLDNGYYSDFAFDTTTGPVTTRTGAVESTEGISGYYKYELKMISGIKS